MRWHFRYGAAAALTLALALPGLAVPLDEEDGAEPKEQPEPRQKHPSVFHRPAMNTPAEQLAYGDRLRAEGRRKKASRQYRNLVHQWHESPEAARAQMAYATLLEERGKYPKAFDEYQYLVRYFTGYFRYDEVLERQFRIAQHRRTARSMKFLFFPGFEAPERALPLFEKLVENGPGWSRAAEAQFLVAYTQEETGEFEAAVASYEILHYRYPRSEYAEESVFRRAQCLYRVAKSAPRNEESCRQALASYSAFLRDYPDNPKAAEAGQTLDDLKDRLARMYYERAVFYDKRGKTRKSALIAYQDFVRRFPASDLAASARDRVAELEDEAETNENTP